ncbi:hypothetical protein A3D11_04520 [Candidatus Peribacteria bacterium RIFCSPHIGHO2_02_FULL_49_16]|nr:MAG: hypothetical protein A2880_04085 [Candidatus Peribacteria bacterium RIFCSPHIGHO2_01_FULL_49_38]OGJ58965.1 MAG: hypothetical protein A3D11_04520 [Candidatus Peribacteria bacterium RIFCSPHIGHO2_02_FULL_49_16]
MSEQQNKDKELAERYYKERVEPLEGSKGLSFSEKMLEQYKVRYSKFLEGDPEARKEIEAEFGEASSTVQTELPTREGKSALSDKEIENRFSRGRLEGNG